MMISTKGRYALRVMTELAECEEGTLLPLKEIAQKEDISEKYLEAIIKGLVKSDLVIGTRGKGGGYRLAKTPAEYTILEILEATEGSLAPVACLDAGHEHCRRTDQCPTLPMWQGLDQLIRDYFSGITLAQLSSQIRENPQHCID